MITIGIDSVVYKRLKKLVVCVCFEKKVEGGQKIRKTFKRNLQDVL